MKESMTKAELLRPRPPAVRIVELPEETYGAEPYVFVRAMSGHARSEFERKWAGKEATGDPGAFRWDLVLHTLCDSDGNLLLEPGDRDAFMALDAGDVECIFEAAGSLNGLRKDDIEELAGN